MQATGGPLLKGQTVLVTAAGGATGHIGAQLALLAGCHVVATCGSACKAERLRSLGIHRVINYKEEVRRRGQIILVCHGLNMHASYHPTCISASARLRVIQMQQATV